MTAIAAQDIARKLRELAADIDRGTVKVVYADQRQHTRTARDGDGWVTKTTDSHTLSVTFVEKNS